MSGATIPPLTPEDLIRLCEFLYKHTGIQYGESKRFYIERRLIERMSQVGLNRFSEYLGLLRSASPEVEHLINSFTVNETYFYREDDQLRCLIRSLLPEIVQARAPGDLVRIWSVPCSTGEEPYSIAIWLLENWHLVDAYNIEIVGSDIDTRVLAEAAVGVYGERALSRLSSDLIERYFKSADKFFRQIIEDLRESVKFTQTNLVEGPAMAAQGKFDIIFCRNVLIYFDDASRLAASHNLYEALNPGGFICLGHSESMSRISDRFEVRRFRRCDRLSTAEAVMDDLLEQFLIEGRELVAQASDDLISLERLPSDAARIDSLFRAIHTLKGSVGLFDFAPMGSMLHAAEDLLGSLRSKNSEVDRSTIDALLACIDASERWIEVIARTGRLPPGADREGRSLSQTLSILMTSTRVDDEMSDKLAEDTGPSSATAESGTRTMRVDAARIDSLADLVGELIVAKNNLGHLAAQASRANSPLANAFVANVAGFERLTNEMNRAVTSLRMMPVSRIFGRFPRWMRDTASKLGKSVEFEIRDGGVEADKSVVDGLFEPLLHILRNAIDHGIEDSQSRQSSGKPARGRITLEARADGDQIVISVSDDGVGLNPIRLRNAAKRKGLLSDEAIDALDDAAASELIFMPGFSSSDAVTDISGRGVGMDAVRTAIATLGGRIWVNSSSGTGTTVQMMLPQAALSTTVIVAEVGEDWFGIPINGITGTTRVSREQVRPIRDGEAFVLRDRTLPLLRLAELLHLPYVERTGREGKVLIATSGGQPVGVEVDGFGERLDVFLRPLTGLLSGMPGVIGTALLGDGRVLLVLDLPELIG